MKYVYAGGMTISHRILRFLCEENDIPEYVFGYPPCLSHRSNYRALADLAKEYGFDLLEIENVNDAKVERILKEVRPDWFMVFGWSQLVKEEILRIPRYGTLGFHMTKLPEGRGRAPVAWTVIKGKKEGWASLIWLEPGADNGDIAMQRSCPISIIDDAETVIEKISDLACEIVRDVLPDLRNGRLARIPQDDNKATYWEKRTPEDGIIDWHMPVKDFYNFIRGITRPFPGAFSYLNGEKITIWKVGILELEHPYYPGRILGPYYSHGRNYEVGMAVAANGGLAIVKSIEDEQSRVLNGPLLLKKAEAWQGSHFDSKKK